jgi:serine protease Do
MKNRTIPVIFTAAVTSIVTLFAAAKLQGDSSILFNSKDNSKVPVNYVGYNEGLGTLSSTPPVDFQPAAEASVKAVVHIKTTTKEQLTPVNTWFGDYYAVMPEQKGSGSGVVISDDGYIVTNNHVVKGADEVTVTFNDRYTAIAKVVGTDVATDIAVLKVKETKLPFMEFGNSDDIRLGQWVLAVGYPFTLDATVTAGIVSAKSRAIGINGGRGSGAVESFIQTDAAVNPGNSGGALVNMKGQVIGINSAIASPTGSYAGYSYSIPANIVRKVVNDIISTGAVQRAYLGINFYDRKELTPQRLKELGIDRNEGVYVAGVQPGSGAANAGIKQGDFITQVNNINVNTEPELLEKVATFKPGDNINVTYKRGDNINKVTVMLKKLAASSATQFLGATFKPLDKVAKSKIGIRNGILVEKVGGGALAGTNMKDNFLIIGANGKAVNSVEDLRNIMMQSESVQLEGFYQSQPNRGMFYYGLNKAAIEE